MRLFSLLLVVLLLVGCASKYDVKPEEIDQFTLECGPDEVCLVAKINERQLELDYDKQVFLDEQEDELRSYLVWCAAADRMLIYNSTYMGAVARRKMMGHRNRLAGYPYIARHVSKHDFACMTRRDGERWLRQQMGGY